MLRSCENNNHPLKKMNTKPYKPIATIEQVIAYRPDEPETHTPSRLVNAVAEALYATKFIEVKDLAAYMELTQHQLATALGMEMGMSPVEVLHHYRLLQAQQYVKEHPDQNLDQVAHAIGYASAGSLWRFFERKLGITPRGQKSEAGEELWLVMEKALREHKNSEV